MQPKLPNTAEPPSIADNDEIPIVHGTIPSLLFIARHESKENSPKLGLKMDGWEECIQVKTTTPDLRH